MVQIVTPLVQLLNQGNLQQQPSQVGQNFVQGAKLAELQKTGAQNREVQQENLDQSRTMERFKSLAVGASEIIGNLENKDFEKVNQQLLLRRQDLIRRNKPTNDTDQFIALLASDPDAATSQARNAINTAKMLGIIKTAEGARMPFQLGTSRTINRDGKLIALTEVFNRETKELTTVETPLDGQIVSKNLGETSEDLRERQVLTETQKKSAGFAQKASADAFAQLQPIREAVGLYNEAIELIDAGADTGVIASKLPSLTDLAIKLDNVQSRLGLNVIRQTTFGSLSEAELKFALDSALPPKLSEAGLRKWLVDKRDAQEKLADYITDSAIYLGQPGNSIASWFQLQRDRKKQADSLEPKVPVAQAKTLQDISQEELLNLSLEDLKRLKEGIQ